MTQTEIDFSASELIPERDGKRIARQRELVRSFMSDGQWHTLREIAGAIKQPEASVSARLREFKGKERRYVKDGLWEYRINQEASWQK